MMEYFWLREKLFPAFVFNPLQAMNNLGKRPLAAGAISRSSHQALTTLNITEFSRPLFAAIYVFKQRHWYLDNKKYIIALLIIIFIIITNVT